MEATPENLVGKAARFGVWSNLLLALIKGVAGILGHSHALVADAIESTADVFSSFLLFLGMRYAQKPADANHPYGHGKVEPLITFVIVGFLIISATVIAYESIAHIRNPHKSPEGWTLWVLAGIILWKELSYRYIRKKGKKSGSSALKAEAWHHRSDALTSIAAFIGISVALLMGDGYEAADDWAALFASGLILYNCYKIFRPALGEVMDEDRFPEMEQKIRDIAHGVPGILDTEKCFVRKAGMVYHIDLHAIVDAEISVRAGHDLAHVLEDALHAKMPELGHIAIHIEPEGYH